LPFVCHVWHVDLPGKKAGLIFSNENRTTGFMKRAFGPVILICKPLTLFRLSIHLLACLTFLVTSPLMAQTLETVPSVDLTKYSGKWFEIASYPQPFQKGCTCTTAEYTLSEKGFVIVENKCRKDSINGKVKGIKGKAWVQKNCGNAKLKVQFFWPFRGDYWIIDLAPDYRYAVVSAPNKNYLWILCRKSQMPEEDYTSIIKTLQEKGFNTNKLLKTIHSD
jgi:apolipoprotein D and lipocalin family protein